MEAQRASQEQTKQQASVTVAQASATEKVNVTKFVAGNLATHMQSWKSTTSDRSILDMVAGYSLEFDDMPFQTAVPHSSFSKDEELIIAAEIKKLLEKGVINEATHGANKYISTVFTRPKKDGCHRLILNLKNLNQFVTYQHFKMESLQSAVQLIQKDSWIAVLDLKYAYYSVPTNPQHRKYLRFEFKDTLYEFTCLPNGLASAPRVFTKVMKPVIAILRSKGYLLVIYIDDILLMAATPLELSQAINDTISLLRSLGFTIHDTKSVTTPTQVINFLGFALNSQKMTISMVPGKADVIKSKCHTLVHMQGPVQIREVASVVGLMVSAFSGVQYAPLFYRSLENDKTMKCNGWDLEGKMTLSPLSKQDLLWWISNVDQYPKAITPLPPDITLMTDSSLKGWGGVIEGTPNVTGGRWSYQESKFHINYLELKAILLVLQSLCNRMQCCHIHLLCDNTTAVSYIRNMGGTKSRVCNEMPREIIK